MQPKPFLLIIGQPLVSSTDDLKITVGPFFLGEYTRNKNVTSYIKVPKSQASHRQALN